MTDAFVAPDETGRRRALDVSRSFIVQAPAGSGKTELLIQRYLALLSCVERPEEIAAITFTVKAASEMRGRVLAALRAARTSPRPPEGQAARTWDLARAALERDASLGWKLEESADRLKVQTIDALCASLTRQMPVLSRFGGQPEVIEDATALFSEAARELLAMVEEPGEEATRVASLLRHLDNDAAAAEKLIAEMLARRDQWLRTLLRKTDRESLERALDDVRRVTVEELLESWPAQAERPQLDMDGWIAQSRQWLTGDGKKWRQRPSQAPEGIYENDVLLPLLRVVKDLPAATYSDAQWEALDAMLKLAPIAIAQLQVVFAKHGKADFTEFALRALRALECEEGATDLMLVLDYRIRHILVDEFQDTSFTQFKLLQLLTSGWEPGDGRTLFVVGDPMQSIYRFREAEVGLFLQAWERGVGSVALEPVTLSANFRSHAGIVEWVNSAFAHVMPQAADARTGAVKYERSHPVRPEAPGGVHVHPFYDYDSAGQARAVADVAREAMQRRPDGSYASVAILVRNRSHLFEVLPRLREAGIAYRAVEIDSLGHRPTVADLLALTRAVSHLADRVAWLSILRAPWCGLTLADLLALAPEDQRITMWEAIRDEARLANLSADGRMRLQRTREVLARALDEQGRRGLRDVIERAWLALAGPACVEGDVELEDADTYLDHLEAMEQSGWLPDLRAFEESVTRLFALPDLASADCVQVMTIHKAKGLEFDSVIVPGLAGQSGRDDRSLFMWMETADGALLLAPIQPSGAKPEAIYEMIRRLDKTKSAHEMGRLLYVAATRARSRLHLMGDAKRDSRRAGAVQEPAGTSLLGKLWPAVARHFEPGDPRRNTRGAGRTVPLAAQTSLRRLDLTRLAFEVPAGVAWRAPEEREERDPIEFSWVGDTSRRVGSVVHRWLQRVADEEMRGWNRARVERQRDAIRASLVAAGVIQAELDQAAARVAAALNGALEDPRGKWLLGPHPNARNEYRLTTYVDGARRDIVIDRMWEDLAEAWVVDYKTSSHEGAGFEKFLDAEAVRYRPQLEGYAAALGKPGARRGLYFPLLKGWREWGGG
ncbi:MAG TPA: UvrD-helicase domain-containing protein [Usitatibacter sp.]|nr:UvrD-helicase domain-containing protein [Usitatibacter sp.]